MTACTVERRLIAQLEVELREAVNALRALLALTGDESEWVQRAAFDAAAQVVSLHDSYDEEAAREAEEEELASLAGWNVCEFCDERGCAFCGGTGRYWG
jgi:hypothetical protein